MLAYHPGMSINNRRLSGMRPYGVRQIALSAAFNVLKIDHQTNFQVDTTPGALQATLVVRAADWAEGTIVGFTKTAGGANPLTIAAAAGDTINGAANITVTTDGAEVKIRAPGAGGTNWTIV